jgi:Fe-S-cluster containining protein
MSPPRSELRFECTQCGECCKFRGEYTCVYLNRDETRALAEHLKLPLGEFGRRYTFVDEDAWRQLKTRGDGCIFLDEQGRCSVYQARPTQCRTFPFWREFAKDGRWTDEVRGLCEGIDRGRLYSIEEAEDQMLIQEVSET